MTNEELILERLESIESQLAPLAQSAKSMSEFKDDLTFLAQPATQVLVKELADVEASFQLEDLMELAKRMLKSVRNITWSLGQLENIIDFVTTLEPLLKTSVPQIINYLDDLEQRGVLRIIGATLDFRSKVAEAYTPEDIDQIGDGLVALLNLAKKISDPQAVALLEQLAEMPASVDLTVSKDVGPWGLFCACYNKEVKEGLGVLMELTKAMGKMKGE
ncbi:MAG: DUF1641 domain-containing protein [Syntrophobacteria bacterium]|jgi:uncharacterized protein YjgD (DUF1641 family)